MNREQYTEQLRESIERDGIFETLVSVIEAVTGYYDEAITAGNKDANAVEAAVSAVMTGITADLVGLNLETVAPMLPQLLEDTRTMKFVALGAYCMGYRKGQERGKGLILVVKESDDQA